MRIDVSLLPALAAAFMLVFARVGAMVMLLPGLGETNIPTRIKLAIALLLALGGRRLTATDRMPFGVMLASGGFAAWVLWAMVPPLPVGGGEIYELVPLR